MAQRSNFANGIHSFATALQMKPLSGLIWFTCWSAWTVGSLQFYLLPFTLSNIAKTLEVAQSRISEVNTYTMLSRSIGAIIFGILRTNMGGRSLCSLISYAWGFSVFAVDSFILMHSWLGFAFFSVRMHCVSRR